MTAITPDCENSPPPRQGAESGRRLDASGVGFGLATIPVASWLTPSGRPIKEPNQLTRVAIASATTMLA